MEFWKMNGAGNDFIVVDDRRNAIPENRWPEIVRVLCERHMSIGADGFMVVKPHLWRRLQNAVLQLRRLHRRDVRQRRAVHLPLRL